MSEVTTIKRKKRKKRTARDVDLQLLYQASVQCVEADVDFIDRVYKKQHGKRPATLREDFCGTAWLSCDWVKRRSTNTALCVDNHQPTLDWAGKHNVASLEPDQQDRITLVCDDVRDVLKPKVDVVVAANFSYFFFKDRPSLGGYFRSVRQSLAPGGMLVADACGGTESMMEEKEKRKIEASIAPDGRKVPAFTYTWEQSRFNVINHDLRCHIHFKLADGTKIKKAFSYEWRLWTLPEIQELMLEAGFKSVAIYLDGWDDEKDEADGVYRKRTYYENMAGWVAYIVAWT